MASPTNTNLHQIGGTAAVVGGIFLSAGCILRTMYESEDTVDGVAGTGAVLLFLGLLVASFGYMRNYMADGTETNDSDNVAEYAAKIAAALLLATVGVWTFVRMIFFSENINLSGETPPYCGHSDHGNTTVDPAFMEIGVAGNSEIDIAVSIAMFLIMTAYYGRLWKEGRIIEAERYYVMASYVLLMLSSFSNMFIAGFSRGALGGPSPFDNTSTHIKAMAHYRVTSMALIALQLVLAGALSISSKKSAGGGNSFFKADPSGELEGIVVLHRCLQFLFATATFVGAVVLAFATGAYHTDNETKSIALMACDSPATFDQNATGSSLFAFLIPYLLSVWWDMTKM
jgi:hypothetical protein